MTPPPPHGDATGDAESPRVVTPRLHMVPAAWSSSPSLKGVARVPVDPDLQRALASLAGGNGTQTFSAIERVESRALWRSFRTECAVLRASINQVLPVIQHTQQRRLLDAALPMDDLMGVGEAYMFCVVRAAALDDICAHGVDPLYRFTSTPRAPVGPGRVTLMCRVALAGIVCRGQQDSQSCAPERLITPAEAITVGLRQAYPEYVLYSDPPQSFTPALVSPRTAAST